GRESARRRCRGGWRPTARAWPARSRTAHRMSPPWYAKRTGRRRSGEWSQSPPESATWLPALPRPEDPGASTRGAGRVRTTCYIEGCFGFPTGYHSRKTGPNLMKIHEYQAKAILGRYPAPVHRGKVAFTAEAAE